MGILNLFGVQKLTRRGCAILVVGSHWYGCWQLAISIKERKVGAGNHSFSFRPWWLVGSQQRLMAVGSNGREFCYADGC
jgi:hypothetical protein